MKRISFKDNGGLNLTQAVLSGRKTMTRREVPIQVYADAIEHARYESDSIRAKFEYILKRSPYKVGEIVAIQQAYKYLDEEVDLYKFLHMDNIHERFSEECKTHKGWTNKMFVKAELMHHHIRIIDIRVERLQDISDEDCLQEGVVRFTSGYNFVGNEDTAYLTPSKAFAALIDKVSGRGTWERNPLVWVYSFELVD